MSPLSNAGPGLKGLAILASAATLAATSLVLGAAIALAGLGQFHPELDVARIPTWFWYYRHDPDVRRWLAVGLFTATLGQLILATAVLLSRRRPLHGAAHWATAADQARAGVRARSGVILGRARSGSLLIADGPEHVMLYAPTRSGKGVGVVIPNLLAWPGSVVVLDIKRENFQATAGYRHAHGQTVLLFDPLAADGRTARYNPLGHIDRRCSHGVVDELQRMAAMLFTGHDHTDPFWSEAARTGFIGIGAWVAETPDAPFTLGEIFRRLTWPDLRARLDALLKDPTTPLSAGCRTALGDFSAASDNTFASIRQTLTSRMGLWLNPRVDAATSASDFDMADLPKGRLSIYLGASPDNLLRVAPLYALLFQQLVDRSSRRLPQASDRPVLVLLDEFARLGPAPVLAQAFAWVAGYGLRLLPVIQSPSQLRALYGPDLTEAILANCGYEVVFAPKGLGLAKELSERLGDTTVRARSRSRPAGLSPGRRSLTESDQRRALMLPQELTAMSDRELIVLKAGAPPIRGRKIVYYRERIFRRRLMPPPPIPALPQAAPPAFPPPVPGQNFDFDSLARELAAEGLPPPPATQNPAAFETWVDLAVDRALAGDPS